MKTNNQVNEKGSNPQHDLAARIKESQNRPYNRMEELIAETAFMFRMAQLIAARDESDSTPMDETERIGMYHICYRIIEDMKKLQDQLM